MKYLEGTPISPGYASGMAVVYDFDVGRRIEVTTSNVTSSEVESEWKRLDEALERSRQDLQLLEQSAIGRPDLSKSLAVLSAHSAMTHEIADLVKQHVGRELVNVEEALDSVICDWVERLQRLDSEYLRQREQDVRDVGRRVTRYLTGSLPWSKGPLPPGSIVVARELMPSEAIELINCGVVAIVCEHGGKYSHTAIVARSLGVPAITGIKRASSQIHPGVRLLVDGQRGNIVVAPTESEENSFAKLKKEYEDHVLTVKACGHLPCATEDGITVSLLANIGLPDEIDAVGEHNLAGVGLFRTEFLFLESHERPSAQKQFEVYDKMASDLNGQPLVIRTFDLGGDKMPPFLLEEQSDAQGSLHLRGLRFSLVERDLLDEQLHAILRVAQTSDVRILLPMVIGRDDLEQAIAAINRIAKKCGYLRTPPVGAMIETPAALYSLADILDLADFLALGTNDLTQYMLATDRDLAEGQDDCTALHPAVLRAIKQVVDASEKHQCPICICGEEAGDAEFACLLIGLGIREVSLSPGRAGIVRQALRGIKQRDAVETANQALCCHNPQQVRALLRDLYSSGSESAPHLAGASEAKHTHHKIGP